VGVPHPLMVVRLQVPVEKAVSELEPALATNTLPSEVSRATASGPDPVGTEAAVTELEGLPLLPSLSTVTLPLDLLAM
jgi:hypothetical protein